MLVLISETLATVSWDWYYFTILCFLPSIDNRYPYFLELMYLAFFYAQETLTLLPTIFSFV